MGRMLKKGGKMMDFYEFIDQCREDGLSGEEALGEWERAVAERHERFLEDYYNDAEVQYGWYQQDMIDQRWMER